jgi:hypothetical protein
MSIFSFHIGNDHFWYSSLMCEPLAGRRCFMSTASGNRPPTKVCRTAHFVLPMTRPCNVERQGGHSHPLSHELLLKFLPKDLSLMRPADWDHRGGPGGASHGIPSAEGRRKGCHNLRSGTTRRRLRFFRGR